jgi:ATP-dependent DNA helicase RecQ
MALRKPTSLAALSGISGVGTAKLERYGEAFIAVIAAHTSACDRGTAC